MLKHSAEDPFFCNREGQGHGAGAPLSGSELIVRRRIHHNGRSETPDKRGRVLFRKSRAAAREVARVLRPGGRLVAAVWAAPEECDIVMFQQTAGSFAPPPPVPGVGPGAMADTGAFLGHLAEAGIQARVEQQQLGFDFGDFESAWEVLAGVTTAQLAREIQEEAKQAVRDLMWQGTDGPRHFRNTTQFIMGRA